MLIFFESKGDENVDTNREEWPTEPTQTLEQGQIRRAEAAIAAEARLGHTDTVAARWAGTGFGALQSGNR